jgi:heat shock protein HslJ
VPAAVVHIGPAAPRRRTALPEPIAPAARPSLVRAIPRVAIAIAVGAILTVAAGCSASAPALDGRSFLSVGVTDGGVAKALVAGTRIRLAFTPSNVGASAGCNSISGAYRIDGDHLVFENAAMTEMGCDQDRNAQDQWLIQLLGSRPLIRLTGDELVLESGTIVVHLLDRRVVEPDVALVGATWTVESIISGDAVSNIPGGATATLVFAADGTLVVHTGCNQGGATWKSVAGGIEVSNLVLTKKACAGAGAQLESAVVAVLGAAQIAASIESNSLTLQAGAAGLQLRAS